MKRYNPSEIEPKWQHNWDESGVYTTDLHSKKPKYVGMSMFNYPSGAGIHIGHAMNYTISDVMARFKRQQGFESYHPVGWDAFGLPAENYAIKAGVSPQDSMATIIPSYHQQYKAMGWSNDWTKEIATHKPEYYKWTQWIFSQMYKDGLAYQDARMQWWCDKCQTVLANEQIDAHGKCWRHDGPEDVVVTKREVKQWFFKITEYADELLQATEDLDWTDSVKLAQKNWIGKSEGAKITFSLSGLGSDDDSIDVFTTAHDTIYGATFMVLAPEHPVVSRYAQLAENAVDITDYVAAAARKSELERLSDKHKHGVPIEGLFAVHPLTGETLPVWVAEYVMIGYGTGAIMAVPGEDDRDYAFAEKYNIPIIYTTQQQEFISYSEHIKSNRADYTMANSGEFDGLDFETGRTKILDLLAERGVGKAVTNYKIRDWSVSRQRYWGAPIPIINCDSCGHVLVPDDQLPVELPVLVDFQPSGDGRSALARATDWLKVDCPQCGGPAERETDTLDTYICSSWYMLRYLDPANSEKIFDSSLVNEWMPIDFYNGGDHATAHMIYARFITRFFYKKGLVSNPEPFKRFLFNGKVMASDGSAFSKSKGNGVDPLEIISQGYGADSLRTYLMFAAPLEFSARWDPNGVPGTYRFLSRVWNIVQECKEATFEVEAPQPKLMRIAHSTIQKVTHDLEEQKYNTAIAACMKATNDLYDLKASSGMTDRKGWEFALVSLTALIAPFAPHIADEIWGELGQPGTVQRDSWPQFDESYLVSDTVKVMIQVNGKLRGEMMVAPGITQEQALESALQIQNIQQFVADKKPTRVIFVPGRLLNIVV